MVGHQGAVKLDGSYFKPDADKLFGEYCKHMNNLMIDDSQKVVQSQQAKIVELETAKDAKIRELESKIDSLFEMISKKD